jgi:peptide/nickel transport system permease protein
VVSATISRWGARLGLAWIVFVAFLGVAAPLLANTYPLVLRTKGELTFPAFRYMNWTDVTLLTGALMAPFVYFFFARSLVVPIRLLLIAGMFGVLAIGTYLFVRPPQLQAFEDFRRMEAAGEVEWAVYAPIRFSPTDRLRDQTFDIDGELHPWSPRREHLMGTDVNRSDVLSRMIHASRIAMSIGFIATGLSLVIGVIVGAVMGYYVKWVDLIGMRVLEVFDSIPTLFLMLAAVAFFGRNLYIIMLIIGLTGWVGIARFVRAEFLRLRNVDYVMAAQALGLPLRSILFKHLLPNALAPVLVSVSFGVASAILSEATLSFLGLGLIDEPSWGAMLNQAVGATGGFLWWLAVFPGVAIFFTVLAYNLVGEALRDALDPRLLKREA